MKRFWFLLGSLFCFLLPLSVKGAGLTITNQWIPGVYGNKYQGNINYYGPMSYLKLEDRIGYCLDPYLLLGDSYERRDAVLQNFSQEQIASFQLYDEYVHRKKGNDRYYLAAQELIWRTVTHDRVLWTTKNMAQGDPISVEEEKKELNDFAEKIKLGPMVPNRVEGEVFQTLTFMDSTGTLDQYQLMNHSHHRVEIRDQVLIVQFLDDQPGTIELLFETPGTLEGYFSSGSQAVGFFGGYQKKQIITLQPTTEYQLFLEMNHTYSSQPVPGLFQFEIIDLATNQPVVMGGKNIFETYLDGTYHSPEPFKRGKYRIHYIAASEPYLLPEDQLFEVSYIKEGLRELTVTIPLEMPEGILNLYRYQDSTLLEHSYPVSNVTYLVYNADDIYSPTGELLYVKGHLFGMFVTDQNGYGTLSSLPLGNYFLVEDCDSNNYVAPIEPLTFSIIYQTDHEKTIVVKKEVTTFFPPHQIQVKDFKEMVFWEDEMFLYQWQGIDDIAYLYADTVAMYNYPIWQYGELIFTFPIQKGWGFLERELPKGNYYIETSLGRLSFEVTEEYFIFLDFERSLDRGTIQITVVDEEENPLGQIPIQLVFGSHQLEQITSFDGIILFSDFPYGQYEVKEINGQQKFSLILDHEFLSLKIVRNKPIFEGPPSIDEDVLEEFPEQLPNTSRNNNSSLLLCLFLIGGLYRYQK